MSVNVISFLNYVILSL